MKYVLAPLAGFTDAPFRRLCFEGGADLAYTEMVSAAGLAHGSSPTRHLMETMSGEGPVALQLFGAKESDLAYATRFVEEWGGRTLDERRETDGKRETRFVELNLNAGCPMTKVTREGAGAKLIEDPEKIYRLLKAMVENTSLPVTLKTRLGPHPQKTNVFEIVDAAERAGAKGLVVHARYTSQMHGGPTHLDTLAEVVARAKVPVTGNGSVVDAKTAAAMAATGVDAIMIGRASLAKPSIFSELKMNEVKERGEGEQWDCPLVEVICVDDGSTDGSGAILDEYVRRQSNNQTIPNQTIFKVIHQANRGLSAARNAALDQATGEWLVYLDGDDLLPEGALGACERAINANPDADIIRGHMLSFNDGERISIPKTTGAIRSVDLSGRIADFCTTGCFPQYVLKASTFGDLRFYGASWCEERPYGAKCAARIRIAVDVDDYVYAFRARAGSITHTPMSLDQFRGYLQATKDMMRTYSESGRSVDPGVIHRVTVAWMEHQVFFLCTHLTADAKVEAWRFWFDSLDELGCGLPVPAWFRFVRFVCRTTRSCVLAWGLCFLPEWLKMHGLHRQKRVVR